mmetsp:Transcript_23790/g.32721  ORF Transcript_23790/g.32721 Transcript_23790/m.32721 type:complete len:587 (+) Transcript_23790:54-1814(+)
MDYQEVIEKLSFCMDDVERKIAQAEQQGNEAKAISLRGEKIALINERTETRKLFGQQQALAQVPVPGFQRKKKPYEVGNEDNATHLYFGSLNSVRISSAEELKAYLASDTNVQKMTVNSDLSQFEFWSENFVSKACIVAEPNADYCEALLNALVAFACSASDVTPHSENSIISFMDLALRLVEHLARRPRERNISNNTSGKYRPDSFIPMGINGAVCVTVEEKPLKMYKQGVMGSDPEFENLQKIDFANWEKLYGDTPYIICFSVIADHSIFLVKMGAIEFRSRQNVELYRCDLRMPGARAHFAFKVVQMLPVLKAIIEGSSTALIPMIRVTTHSRDRAITKTIQAIQCPAIGSVLVEKEWECPGVQDMPLIILCQFQRMNLVFDRIGDNNIHERFGVIRRITYDNLSFHTIGLRIEGNTAVVEPRSHHIGMKGFFSPYGIAFNPVTLDQLLQALLSVALIVQFLQRLRIVHNDIRWKNLCAVEVPETGKPLRMLLFDFDDAFALETNVQCPGFSNLSLEEHPLKSQVPHGGEVDVWAIGMLISQHKLSGQLPALQHLGNRIKADFETMSIEDIIESLCRLSEANL